MRSTTRSQLNLELVPSARAQQVTFHGARWSLLVALAVLTYLLYPPPGRVDVPIPEEGRPAREAVDAPFDLAIAKSPDELQQERGLLAAQVSPVYEYRGSVEDSVLARTDSLFAALARVPAADSMVAAAQRFGVRIAPEEAQYLAAGNRLALYRRSVRRHEVTFLARGVPPAQSLSGEPAGQIVIRRDGRERTVPRDSVFTYQRYLEARTATHPTPNSVVGDVIYVRFLTGLFRPTLQPNGAETAARRRELMAGVDSVRDRLVEGQRIIDVGEIATPEKRAELLALRQALEARGHGRERTLTGSVGYLLADALILSGFWLLLLLYRRRTYAEFRHLALLAMLFGLVIVGSALNRAFIHTGPALLPIPFAAMLITILFSGRVAMVAAMVLAVLLGTQAVFTGTDALFIALVGGVAAAVSVRGVRRRNELLLSFLWITIAFFLSAFAVGLAERQPFVDMVMTGVRGGINAFISSALVLMSLPLFEKLAGVTTDLTLLELSDPSRPLLRRLATETPGTYAHSIAMANLCEPACTAVGANGLLARVGCYYHDIGKLKKPQFFVENQVPGANPHDKLKPDVSAGIIRNHVRDGLALADEQNLPEAVKAFIPEHHGTMEITYFLNRARERTSDPSIDAEAFRYPGPRPRSVETAVAMLADGVEAALRVLEEPTEGKLEDAIDHIIQQRIEARQLDDAPLTLAQLSRVKQEFMRVLASVYHNRIDYPAASGGIGAEWEAKAAT